MTIDWKQLWRALKRLGRWLNKFPAWLETKSDVDVRIIRFLFFFNIYAILELPFRVLIAKQYVDGLNMVLWAGVCLWEYHWYFSCDFPWQRKKEDQDDDDSRTT